MKNWSMNKKISFLIGIFVMACAIISSTAIYDMNKMDQASGRIVKVHSRLMVDYLNLRGMGREAAIQQKNLVLAESAAEREEYKGKIEKQIEAFQAKLKETWELESDEGKARLSSIRERFGAWVEISNRVVSAAASGDMKLAQGLSRDDSLKARQQVEKDLAEAVAVSKELIGREVERNDRLVASSRWIMVAISIFATLAGIALAWIVLRQLSRDIDRVISDLGANADELTSAAGSIASSSEELSQAATEQAASLQETVASVEEISAMVSKNSDNSKQAADTSHESQKSAERGRAVVTEMIHAIGEISDGNTRIMGQIEQSNQKISEIVSVIAEIGSKTRVINDIVFQTKLLSFNASVEAARAGEHGKGFAVVAEEVGNLAQMSGNAAKEISALLDGSIKKVEEIVHETKTKVTQLVGEGKVRVDSGVSIAQQCGQVLEEIVRTVSQVAQAATEIASASNEQAVGVREINKAMAQLDQVTQQNSAASQMTATAAEQVSRQSEGMRSVVRALVATIKGAGAGVPGKSVSSGRAPGKVASVIPIRRAEPEKVPSAESLGFKKVVGFDLGALPADDHPGFREI